MKMPAPNVRAAKYISELKLFKAFAPVVRSIMQFNLEISEDRPKKQRKKYTSGLIGLNYIAKKREMRLFLM